MEARQLEELTGVCRHNRKTHIKPWATFALVFWHMTIVRNPTGSLFGVKPPACPRLSHLAQVANGLSRGLEDAAAREQLLTKLAQVLRLELKFATLSQEEQILTYLDICILPPIVFQSLIGFFYIEEARKHFFGCGSSLGFTLHRLVKEICCWVTECTRRRWHVPWIIEEAMLMVDNRHGKIKEY